MQSSDHGSDAPRGLDRRTLLGTAAAAAVAGALPGPANAQGSKTGIDAATWTPQYIASIAGTAEYDTAAECAKVVPLNYSGRVTYWYFGPNQASPQIEHDMDKAFWQAFATTYPNIKVTAQNLDYNQMLDKLRTAALGRAAPMVGRLPILWGVEFAAKGQLRPFAPLDVGFAEDEFWPGAIKSVTWKGKRYGVPTNNETMALIWNAALFDQAGLDPDHPPATWDDLVAYSKQIKGKTGRNGYGLVARVNAGNSLRIPNTSNLCFDFIEGEPLVISLDLRGFAISSGSACSSGAVEPSHVLRAIGLSDRQARSSIRISLGASNTVEQVDALADAIADSVAHLRRVSPEGRLVQIYV